MKKTVSIILMLLICFSCVFAYQNTYRQSSEEVQTFLLLRKLSQTITPDPTYPVSASQLADLVKSLDSTKLDDTSRALYENLLSELEHPEVLFAKDGMGIDADVIIGVQALKSDEAYTYGILPFKDRMPMAEIRSTLFMKDYFSGVFNYSLRESNNYEPEKSLKFFILTKLAKSGYFGDGVCEGTPDYAYGSIGFDNINLIIGRDRLEAGNGYTGNLELGGNIMSDNFAKFSFVGSLMSYDCTLDSFDYDTSSGNAFDAKKKNIFIHRMSFNILDKVSVSVYDGALVYKSNPFSDLEFLNPFMFMHNTGTYYHADTNNFAGFEVAAVLPKNYQIDAQLFIDQLCLSFLGEDPVETGETALSALVNVSNTKTVNGGILDSYAEFVYGNPYVYLKNTHGYGKITEDMIKNLDLVNDAKSDFNDNSSRELQYLGYRFGGDLISVGAGASFKRDTLKMTLDLQYIRKGTNGIWNKENREAQEETGPYMHVISGCAGYEKTIFKAVDLQVKAGVADYINYHHQAGQNHIDPQFTIGACIRPLELIKNKKAL